MYARELFIAGEDKDFIEAEKFFLQVLTETERELEEIKDASLVLARAYRVEKNVTAFFKYVMKDMVTEPSSEGCYELGCFYMEQKDFEEACNWFINGMEGSEARLNILYQKDLPLMKLEECYKMLEEDAKTAGDKILEEQYRIARENLKNKEII